MKKLLAIMAGVALLAGAAQADVILTWTFPTNPHDNVVADSADANLDSGGIYNDLTRGEGAPASAGGGFRTQGFDDDGISTANTDFYQIVLSAADGYFLSLSGISGYFVGTASYSSTPGVSHQWAYSLDASSFTLIGDAVTRIGNGTSDFDFSGTSALQDVGSGTDVTLRYYASGNTTTGGWGFNSQGFTVEGSVIPEPGTLGLLGLGVLGVVLLRRKTK